LTNREAEHPGQPSTRRQDDSHFPVHERRWCEPGRLRENDRPPGPVARSADFPRRARSRSNAVGSDHEIRGEHREKTFEVTAAQSREEGVNNSALAAEIGAGNRPRPLHATARAASCLAAAGERPTIGAISSKGTANSLTV